LTLNLILEEKPDKTNIVNYILGGINMDSSASLDFYKGFLNGFETATTNISFDFSFSWLISILLIIEYWFIFQKAGQAGWKVLIPFYGNYIKYKIAKKEKLFWWELGISIAAILCSFLFIGTFAYFIAAEAGGALIASLISCVFIVALGITVFVFQVKRCIGMAKCFGQPAVFGVGILFLEPIFAGILAFNKDIAYNKE
jgi:hypothetical protein